MGAVTATLAEHERVSQGGGTGGNVHGRSTGKVETAELEDPPVGVPGPACDHIVHNGRPDEHENDAWEHATAFGDGTDGKGNTVLRGCGQFRGVVSMRGTWVAKGQRT